MSILEVGELNYQYNGTKKKVLKDINVKFECGKVYGIVGKSGSGKTTLLSLLAGLDTCKQGKICYEGRNLAQIDLDDYRAHEIGIVFQGYNLITTTTALENVILTMDISGVKANKKQQAYQLLQEVDIDRETAGRKVLKLSGGEQQRVGIACAMSNQSKIIFADEPTGNLDSENEKKIMDLFVKLAREQNKCVIIVTHSKRVEKYVDILYGIQNGHLNFLCENEEE